MNAKRRGLGRNLEVLLSSSSTTSPVDAPKTENKNNTKEKEYRLIPVEKITRSPYQPRREFDQVALEELANSIKAQGIIQPVVVRQLQTGDFELIAGERRWRASQIAGLHEIPAIVRDISDSAVLAMALIENIQRENLNPIEEAYSLHRLIEEFDMTHQQAAEAVGRSRTSVTNLLRLLSLNSDVKTMLEHGDIEMGHARALLTLDDNEQFTIANEIVEKRLSVRETEKLIKLSQAPQPQVKPPQKVKDPDVVNLENRLSEILGAKINVKHQEKGNGHVVIHYNNLEELDGILQHIT